MEVPDSIREQGAYAVNEYERGYYHGSRLGNWDRVMSECGPTGLSQLVRGDEQGKPPPGAEVFGWPEKHLTYLEFHLFHEGGAFV